MPRLHFLTPRIVLPMHCSFDARRTATWPLGALHTVAEPLHGVASDGAVAFGYVRPRGIPPEPDKDTQGALVSAFEKYDLIAFMKNAEDRFGGSHVSVPFLVFL